MVALALGAAARVHAGPCDPKPQCQALGASGQINISGATLFRDYFTLPAALNDWIDADNDGLCGRFPNPPFVDVLAYNLGCNFTSHWTIHQRATGSVEGLNEFVTFQLLGLVPTVPPSDKSSLNGKVFYLSTGPSNQTGCSQLIWPPQNAYLPIIPDGVDLAVMDVPTTWAIQGPTGTPLWSQHPEQPGYGRNPRQSTSGYRNLLESLARDGKSLNTNVKNPDANTVFDTPICWVPIAVIANRGTGLKDVRATAIQHLMVSGRMPNGENLVGVTRDIGSGTRNGCMNTLCIDPSFGVGENLGNRNNSPLADNLGPGHIPTNKGGSSHSEVVVENRRLAVGYTGLAGSSGAAGDAAAGKYEILNVMNDQRGGAGYVRPTVNAVLDNLDPSTGWQVGGAETFASRGNPFGNPPVTKPAAADYLRNIVCSVNTPPGTPANQNMPGEAQAITYFLLDGVDALPDASTCTFVANANLNQELQNWMRANNDLGVPGGTPPYGITPANHTPKRDPTGAPYGDGSVNGDYRNPFTGTYGDSLPGGYSLKGLGTLNPRNALAGDCNNDGLRDVDDIPDLVAALADPVSWAKTAPGSTPSDPVVPEIIGDFDGDGNLTVEDVRYFSDGLALTLSDAPQLDRQAGFVAVDTAFGGNFFGTTLPSGVTYKVGDSRADVAGTEPWRGAQPHGHDGTVDCEDVRYVRGNIAPDGATDWDNLDEAANYDLSCDMNGDLKVDYCDVIAVQKIMGLGDLNCDGKMNNFDIDPFVLALTNPAGYAAKYPNCYRDRADVNCDGAVNNFDIDPFVALLTLNCP